MEIWKPLPGSETFYEVSSLGYVKSLDKITQDKTGKIYNRKGKILALCGPCIGSKYVTVKINNKTCYLHRVVATTFIPNPLNLREVNHKNAIKTDNRVENLEWCSSKQNKEHAIKLGLNSYGVSMHNAKLNPELVREIRSLISDGYSLIGISRKTGIHWSTIRDVKVGNTWKQVK